jgi:hypothetical protein
MSYQSIKTDTAGTEKILFIEFPCIYGPGEIILNDLYGMLSNGDMEAVERYC